jgi:3-oxoacyl-[acyl-carrier-protein] synthase III
MTSTRISGVRLSALACAVPSEEIKISSKAKDFGEDAVRKISISTGISAIRQSTSEQTAADLCLAAAERIFADQPDLRAQIGALIFVTQTPDYRIPATACTLQNRLKLPTTCAAFDVNLGCSGYVYGLWMASALVKGGLADKVLLLVGDTITKTISPNDRSVSLIFGDAGSASILTRSSDSEDGFSFLMGTDGSGFENIIIRSGGYRPFVCASSDKDATKTNGDYALKMDGSAVFEFTQSQVVDSIKQLFSDAAIRPEQIDHFVPHQANKLLLGHMTSKIGLTREKLVLGLGNFGNTSCASIPLALITHCRDHISSTEGKRFLLSGFGVGLSWGSALGRLSHVSTYPLVEI